MRVEQRRCLPPEHFERAAAIKCPVEQEGSDNKDKPKPPPFYLNFLSASNFWNVGCWPEAIAAGGTLVAFALAGLVNINDMSLQRFYRDRLMEAFMPDLRAKERKSTGSPMRWS